MGEGPVLADLPEVAKAKRTKRTVAVVGLMVLAASVVAAQPTFRAVKCWRARAMMQDALQEVSVPERREHALSSARAAYRMAPHDLAVIAGAAQVHAMQGDWSSAFAFWKAAIAREDKPKANIRRGIVESALKVGEYQEAEKQLEILHSDPAITAGDHLLSARFHQQTGNAVAAVQAARDAVRLDPALDDAALFLAECLVEEEGTRPEGIALLQTLSAKRSAAGLAAAQRRVGLASSEDPAELASIAQALRSHPLAAEGHRLQALSLDLRRQPTNRTHLLDKAAEHYRSSAPEVRRQFAAWLIGEGEAARALAAVSHDQALSRKDLLLVRLDALAAMKDWSAILQLLDAPRVPIEAASRSLYRARCFAEKGEMTRAQNAWRSALDAAGRDPALLQYVANYAEHFGEIDTARAAYEQLAANPVSARAGFDGLLRNTPPVDTAAARDLLAKMAARWPRDQQVANDLAYLNALLAQELPESANKARELIRAAPASLPHRTVLALAELRMGNSTSALETFEGLDVDWRRAAPASVIVYAAALEANGRNSEARALAALARSEQLRPEERELTPAAFGTM